ncbi:MAG: 2-hydroxyacid dehydrogenase [Actinomycetota bacterium]|nr:MAG: 2-hydroxyacid dehydrogenase [Actinomycetota bacterium]
MTERGRVVVMGASADRPPPGLPLVADAVELRFADTVEALAAALEGADVLFAWSGGRDLLRPAWGSAGSLRWIQAASAGVDGLLFPELVDSDVVLTNARGVFERPIAEHVMAVLLLFAKDLRGVLERQRRREWRPRDTETLEGKRLLVVGVGSIGRAVARTAKAFGMTVRGVGRTTRPDALFGTVMGVDELHDALGWADVVVDVLPATPATHHLFDAEAFAAMNPGVRFVNVGRGSTVDEVALVEALRSGRIAAAALDVFETEPLPRESPLWELPNVVITPHVAGDVAGWREAVVEVFVENLERYLTGEPLKGVVDKRLGFVP